MEIKEEKVSVEIDDSYAMKFQCVICMEYKPMPIRFRCEGCPHYFCFNCIVDHISYRVLGGDIHVRCPEPGCTIGELTYEKWYKHVVRDVRNAWEAAILRESAVLKRCGSCGKFLDEITVKGTGGVRDDCLDALHKLAVAKGWRPCPKCGIFIELTGGCSIITCRCGCLFCYACAKISPEKENTVPKKNQQMEEDNKAIQEYLRNHQEEQQNVMKANLGNKRNVRSRKDIEAGDNGQTSSCDSKDRN